MENKKVKVEVCHGASCFVAGSKIMQELSEIVPKKYGNKIELETCNCLGLCSIHWEKRKAPYVKVDADVINEATTEKVLNIIDEKLTAKAT